MKSIKINNMPDLPYAMEEAVNRLRINISFLGTKIKKIMIISTEPNEGKSFVAMQLWKQIAEAGTPSILLDADMRKSVMADKYEIVSEKKEEIKGLSHYLSSDYPIEEAIFHTQWENGDILPNIDNVINPSMLLESNRFEEMLASDGERIGNLCDGAILVVRGGATSKHLVKNSIRQLERAGCPLLGIVLNRVEGAKSGYYSKRYGSKYYGGKYYNDAYYYGNH